MHNRGKHKKHAISCTVHSVDELTLRHHPKGSRQDCRTCRCMITGRRPRPSPPSRPPPPPPHRQHLLNIALMALPPTPTPAGRSSTAPRYCLGPTSISQHEHLEGEVGDSALERKDSSALDKEQCSSHRSVQCSGWRLASPVSPHEGRTDWLLSPIATSRRPAVVGCCCCCCFGHVFNSVFVHSCECMQQPYPYPSSCTLPATCSSCMKFLPPQGSSPPRSVAY